MIWLPILIFIISCLILFWSGNFLVKALMRIAKFLKWREFVVAFFIMAFAGSAPNLFVGISSAIHKIPQFSLGDVVGGNIVDLTLAFALAILIGKTVLPAPSRVVQTTTIFTTLISLLPLLLISDGMLSRGDGAILLVTFFLYVGWLFSKEERFKLIYDHNKVKAVEEFKEFWKNLGKFIFALLLLILASEGIVSSARHFVEILHLTIPMVGILIIGLGNALPEMYFAIRAAREGETWMVLGDLMGAVIVPATLVLGIVALISPIQVLDFSPFGVSLSFLIVAALFFLFVVRTGEKITKKEGYCLLFLYLLFVIFQLFFNK
jgi:cation:H+ antiporter